MGCEIGIIWRLGCGNSEKGIGICGSSDGVFVDIVVLYMLVYFVFGDIGTSCCIGDSWTWSIW